MGSQVLWNGDIQNIRAQKAFVQKKLAKSKFSILSIDCTEIQGSYEPENIVYDIKNLLVRV